MNMKHLYKKGLYVLMAAALTTVSACSGSDRPDNAGNAPQQTGEGGAEMQGPLKLTVQLEGWGSNVPGDGPVLQEIEKRTNTDLTVDWINYADYEDRFNVQLASGEIPDIMATVMPTGQLFSQQVLKGIKAGIFHDLTPYIEDPEFDKKYPNLAAYDKSVWDMLRFEGKIYAMPRYLQPIAANSAIIMREDLMKKAGLTEEPKTIEELGDFLIKISQETGVYGMQTATKNLDHDNYKPLAVAFTGVQDWGVDSEGNFMYQSFMPEYNDFLLWMKKLYDAKAIDPEFSLEQGGSKFSDGNSAAMVHVWWNWKQGPDESPFSDEMRAKNPDARAWGLLPVQGPKAYTTTIKPFNRPALISSKVKKEDIPHILQLFDYAASQEHSELSNNGIEGIHHEVKDGKIVPNHEKLDADAVGHWYVMFQNQLETAQLLLEEAKGLGVSEKDLARMKQMGEISEAKTKEAGLGQPQWSVESPTYVSKWGFLTKDLNDNRIKVVMGKMTIEEWNQYVKGVTGSRDYQNILKEMKDSYLSGK